MKNGTLPETWFEGVLALCSDPMAISVAETGELLGVNRAYEARSGYRREELLGRNVCEMALSADARERESLRRELRENGAINDIPAKGLTRSGEIVDILLSGRILTHGESRYLLSRAREVSAHASDARLPLERTRRQRAFLSRLSDDSAALVGDVAGAARMVTEECCDLYGAERVSLWLLDEEGEELRCVDLFARGPGVHESGMALRRREFQVEFRELKSAQYIEIVDPMNDPRTSGYAQRYFAEQGISAMLVVSVRLGDRTLGAVCVEHVGARHVWGADEIDFGCHVASLVSVVLERRERRRVEDRLRKAMEGHVRAMATTVEMRDPYTAGHERRVAQLAGAVALEMGGFSEHDIEGIRVAAYMHDLGKIAVPAEILSKPGKINSHEFGIIKAHPQVGYDVLKEIDFVWPIALATLQHHERLDGSGYPQGLTGDQIIPQARVIGVADVVEAMASHRPYRPARTIDEALEEIMRGSGRVYDATVVTACVRLFLTKGFKFEA